MDHEKMKYVPVDEGSSCPAKLADQQGLLLRDVLWLGGQGGLGLRELTFLFVLPGLQGVLKGL